MQITGTTTTTAAAATTTTTATATTTTTTTTIMKQIYSTVYIEISIKQRMLQACTNFY